MAFHVQRLLEASAASISPNDYFANILRASASPREIYPGGFAPGSPKRCSFFFSRPPLEDERKRVFDDVLFCVFFDPWVSPHKYQLKEKSR